VKYFDHIGLRLAVLTQYRSVMDRQTDGRNCYIDIVRCILMQNLASKICIFVTGGLCIRTLRPLFVYATGTTWRIWRC